MSPPGNGAAPGRETEGSSVAVGTVSTAPSLPIYRSPEWHRLAENDPLRVESTTRAADAWYLDGTPERISKRFHDDEVAFRTRIRDASYDLSAVGGWSELAFAPTYEDLQCRRSVPVVPQQPAGWSW